MGDSMMTLFTNGVLGDNLADTVDALAVYSVPLMWVFWLFFFISALTLLNMLIGVLCEVVGGTAKTENEGMEESMLKYVIEDAFQDIDVNQDGKVCDKEWAKIKCNSDVQDAFIGAGLDSNRIEEELEELKIGIFGKTVCRQGLTLEELNDKVIDIRPGKMGSLLALKGLERKQSLNTLQISKEMEAVQAKFREALFARNLPIPNLDGAVASKRKRSGNGLVQLQELPTEMLLLALKGRGPRSSSSALLEHVDQAWEKNPLEEHWSIDYEQYYYLNRQTGETSWQGPSNPKAWDEVWSEDYQQHYYINRETGETRWQVPASPECLQMPKPQVLRQSALPDEISPNSGKQPGLQSVVSDSLISKRSNGTVE